MNEFDSAGKAVLATGTYQPVWLLEMDFVGTTYYWTTHNAQLHIATHTYSAIGGNLRIRNVKEKAGTQAEQLSMTIPAERAYTAAALGNVEGYRGRPARLYLQLLDENFIPRGVRKLRFTGYMQPITIQRDAAKEGSANGRIEMRLVREGLDRSSRRDGARLTDAQQRALYPGDTGLRYMRSLVEKPALWLSLNFQKQ